MATSATASSLIEQLSTAEDIVSALRAGTRLVAGISADPYSSRSHRHSTAAALVRAFHAGDHLCRSYTLRALAAMRDPSAEHRILESLSSTKQLDRQSGAWAAQHHLSPALTPAVTSMLGGESFGRMLAQLAFISTPARMLPALGVPASLRDHAIDPAQSESARISAIECLARLPVDASTVTGLRRVAFDPCTAPQIRAAAVRALGDLEDRDSVHSIARLAACTGSSILATAGMEVLGQFRHRASRLLLQSTVQEFSRSSDPESMNVAETALQALRNLDQPPQADALRRGLHLAQVSMRGAIDAELSSVGEGDGGGLATLLVNLGRAFGRHAAVEQAYTVTRAYSNHHASPVHVRRLESLGGPTSQLVRIPFGPAGSIPAGDMWGYVLQIERGMRLHFSSLPTLDAVHLRFADAGAWGAARWARSAGIPLHFTLAPDPYVPIRSAQAAGVLDRKSFGEADAREHYLYRVHVLDWMVDHAAGLALMPRPHWKEDASLYFGLSPESMVPKFGQPARIRVIAEGIDLQPTDVVAGPSEQRGWRRTLSSHLAHRPSRRGQPAILTVGRLHEVKGLARLVEAWAGDPILQAEYNLIVAGGNLVNPSQHERHVLDQVARVLERHGGAAEGLIMLGSISNPEVSDLLAVVRRGMPNLLAPHGIYVCASEKEEFGLAILEAMAAQLLVVAPLEGGPPTYVLPGQTGFLANTRDIADLRAAIRTASRTAKRGAGRDAITRGARALVQDRYSIDRMADELVQLYSAFAATGDAGVIAS